MREHFYQLADEIGALLKQGEVFTCYLMGEDSDFVRLNQNRVRQAGRVRQIELELDLIEGARHAAARFDLSGEIGFDRAILQQQLEALRGQRAHLPDDPHLLYAVEGRSHEDCRESRLRSARDAVSEILRSAEGLDLVGIWASGPQYRGFANSFGQRNWFECASFNFDWSCYLSPEKAIKSRFAGFDWTANALHRRVQQIRSQLPVLSKAPRVLTPGRYRAYLAPAALQEILDMVSYSGFSLKQHRTKQSSLLKLRRQERSLAQAVELAEDNCNGIAPLFTPGGFNKPEHVPLIRQGRYAESLAAPRSAREYAVPVTAATESPESLVMAGGELALTDVLAALDTGLYINNLWYCNFSDRGDCRLTGMTRYACYWVANGEIKAPINVMRFDDSLYRMLGENLIGLTQGRERRFDADTYHRRSTRSMYLPGALIDGFNLTL
jgi:predicted Zn-dependent protease